MLAGGSRSRYLLYAAVILILVGLAIGFYVSSLTPERKPMAPREKPYDYYFVIDEASGKTLTYVTTVVVSVGDEYMDADGQWYRVVRVEENRAYARRFAKPR